MAEKAVLNKRTVDALEPPAKGRDWHYDAKQPGLAMCVTSAGAKIWYVVRKVDGRKVRYRLGKSEELTTEQARGLARESIAELLKGVDLQARKRAARSEHTLTALFTHWLDHAKAHKKTWKEDQRQFNKLLKPWHSRRLSSISKADVQALHHQLGKKNGHYAANRVLALLRAMFNKADDIGHRGDNPTRGVKKFTEKSRDRFLSPEEMPRFFASIEAEEPIFRDFFLLSLFTGARRGNVQAMAWADVHLDAAVWRIPDTKSGEPVLVHLSDKAVEILRQRKEEANGSAYVFATHSKTGHLIEPKAAWQRVLERAGIADLRLHDLRRTLGSWQAMGGSSLTIIGKSLGHKSLQSTSVYARLNHEPVVASVTKATAAMLEAGKLKTITVTTTEGDSDAQA